MTLFGENTGERAVTPEALMAKADRLHPWLLALMRLFFDSRRRAAFYLFLASYIERNYRLDDALTAIYLQDTDEDTRAPRSIIANAIPGFLYGMKMDGASFTTVLRGWVPDGELMALHAFEESGLNAETLRYLAHSIRMSDKTATEIKKIFKKATYSFIGVQIFAWAVAHYVVPPVFRAIPKRGLTDNLMFFRDVFETVAAVGPYVFVVTFILPVILYFVMPIWVGPWRERVDQLPIFSTYREWQGSIWLRSLAALVAAKMPLAAAVEAIYGRGTPYMNYFAGEIRDNLSGSLPDAMKSTGTEWPSREMITALGIFLSGKNPERSLQMYADDWLENNQEKVNESLASFRLVGYIAGAIAGAWFYLSVNELFQSFTKM